jgi:LPXTG-motif cell wall-anchored protein
MKFFNKVFVLFVLVAGIAFGLVGFTKAAGTTTTVDLGTAANFAILAGTPNITDSPTSSIIGDVGLSPATGAGIGLLSAQVTGTIYAVDAAGPVGSVNDPGLLTTAKNDLTTAFTDAAGRTPVTTVPTELGGTTKTSGVYDSASTTFGITAGAGALVLDGQGDPSAVFIFEMAADGTGLTVGPGSTVSLINEAQACNVFWRVDTATIDTTAVFKGNILALNSITVANGANIEGRLLARNGNVTLINDTITRSTCAASPTPTPTPTPTSSTTATPTSTTSASPTPSASVTVLPVTGTSSNNNFWYLAIIVGVSVITAIIYFVRRKKTT